MGKSDKKHWKKWQKRWGKSIKSVEKDAQNIEKNKFTLNFDPERQKVAWPTRGNDKLYIYIYIYILKKVSIESRMS